MRFGTDGSITTPDPDVVAHLDDEDVVATIEALRYVLDFGTMPGEEAPMRVALAKFETIYASSTEPEAPAVSPA